MPRQKLIPIVLMLGLLAAGSVQGYAADRWQYPIDTTLSGTTSGDSIVTLGEALERVRQTNPGLPALANHQQSARYRAEQAGKWSNPELDIEVEEVGWDAPGFSESEMTIALSQEFELFGQRSARRRLAQSALEAAELRAKVKGFELYLETRKRYIGLVHAQEEYCLAEMAVTLAEQIAENSELRIREGAALQSELLLAQMELQRARLMRSDISQRLLKARIMLASLWNDSSPDRLIVALPQPDFDALLNNLTSPSQPIDSTAEIMALQTEAKIIDNERRLAGAEAKPGITITGGYKRMRADGSNSFVLGLSLPLPLFNRNQQTVRSLKAQLQSLEYEIEGVRQQNAAEFQSGIARLKQLIGSYTTIHSELLPIAEEAFRSLEDAYEAGRLPYSSILEAGRSLIELRFEHNNILHSIYEQIIFIERLTGIRLDTEQP